MSDATNVLLVRHGQSEWNAAGRWQGQADPPLTELGRLQAREAARSVGAVDAIWASDLQRATETAQIIADQVGVGPVVVDAGLRERDAGEFSGLTRAEIDQRFPGYLGPHGVGRQPPGDPRRGERRNPPGWESDESLLERALEVLRRVATEVPGGDVLLITHGGLIYAIEGMLGAEHERIANAGGRWVTISADPRVPLRLGDRLLLADPADTTVPKQL